MHANTFGTITLAAALALGTPLLALAAGPAGMAGQAAGDQLAQTIQTRQGDQTRQAGQGAGDQVAQATQTRQGGPMDQGARTRPQQPTMTPGTPHTPPEPCTTCTPEALVPATATEAANLSYMREEERLARDLYLAFEDAWDNLPFARVAAAEQHHMDAMLRQLLKYQLPDPVANLPIGEFVSEDLKTLYVELLAQGKTDAVAALKVAAKVEEIDVYDNLGAKAETDKADLARAFDALACGSRNHLRAFAVALAKATNEKYTAQSTFLSQAEVDAILAAPVERCGGVR